MMHRMSLTDFCIQLGLYDAEFTRTPTYDALQISRLGGESLEDAWRQLSTNPTYDPCRTKATTLRSPTLKYIHFILSHTLTRRNDSIGVISCGDFNFLLNMIDGFYLHLGYEVAVSILHQGTDPRIGALFVGPYITHLIRCMGILKGADRLRVVGGVGAMTLETLSSMGMLQRRQPTNSSSVAASDLPATDAAVLTPPPIATTPQ